MKTNKPDRPPKFQKAHGLNVASGRRNDIEYIYIGETPRIYRRNAAKDHE